MILNGKRKDRIVKEVAMALAEMGSVPTQKEFLHGPHKPFGLKAEEIQKGWRKWAGVLDAIKRYQPELWELANKPKPAPKPKPATAVKKET